MLHTYIIWFIHTGGVLSDTKNFLKTPPPTEMSIQFGNSALQAGEQIKVSSASTHPASPKWEDMVDDGLYMLMMVDMDAPAKGKDKNKNYLHWLTVNMPYDDVARSNLVQKYTPPNPPYVLQYISCFLALYCYYSSSSSYHLH